MFEQPLSQEFCSTNSWQKPGMRHGSHGGASGCSQGQVVTVNCPVLSSAMFLCGIGCFGVILLHCSVVEMQRNSFRKGTCVFLGLEGEIKPNERPKLFWGLPCECGGCAQSMVLTQHFEFSSSIPNSSSYSGDRLYLQVQWVHSSASVMVGIWSKSLA